jgi:hypothetical protein
VKRQLGSSYCPEALGEVEVVCSISQLVSLDIFSKYEIWLLGMRVEH